MSSGEPQAVEATWEINGDGSARPVLKGGGDLLLLPTHPPRYVDTKQAVIGPVESTLPPAVLSAWTSGPLVKAVAWFIFCLIAAANAWLIWGTLSE